ncbi:30S ribosomal protein S14 [Candidatus Woesearchaeota archaeon]|jgi:ribosomal protein S14|nr:30S ribosomal protein S14 [Candidatus Woesearchaeota archaeon]|tara:strand:+ start:180 stop:401 length:222 start_codon:yes stop_codon:yes gene_type:complete
MKLPGIKKILVSKTRRKKFIRNNSTKKRAFGKALKTCTRCGRGKGSNVGRYNLNICRRCFREKATELGFVKYR